MTINKLLDQYKSKYPIFSKVEAGYKFQSLLPFEAEIQSLELVSKDTLKNTINQFYATPFIPKTDFHAEYYYLVRARIINYAEKRVTDISVEENEDISAYSPKIILRDQVKGYFEEI